MDIKYLGHSCFLIKGKKASLVVDPYDSEMVGLKVKKVDVDIVVISHDHKDHNFADLAKNPKMVIRGPGEYEVMGISVVGIQTFHDDKKGKLRGKNTIYVIEVDGVRVAHLGDLGHKLSEKHLDSLGDVDVLMVPVGGEYTIGPAQAAEIVRTLEPNIVVPMHYQVAGLNKKTFSKLQDTKPFLSDVGFPVEKTNKLSLRKGLIAEEQKIVVFEK